MKKGRNGLVIGLTILITAAAFWTFTPLALAVPTATNIGVADAHGYTDAHVLVPVNITNVQDGPVPSLIFDILYDNSVINVSEVQKGALTLNWDTPAYCNHEWGTRVAIVYDSVDEHAIQNGETGSVVVLNFSVIGELGDTSVMNLSSIQLAEGAPDYQIGTAPAINGTFTVASALPTATNIGVADANGYTNTQVLIPVNITNVQNGPVTSVIFDILCDNSVITVTDVQKGTLIPNWDTPAYCNHEWGTRVTIYDSIDEYALQNGATGSVVLLNFNVIGESGATSVMNFTDIQLAEGAPNFQIGTAPAKNGTFTVLPYGIINGQLTEITGAAMEGVNVTLTANDSSVVLETTTTNETGYFNLSTVEAAGYYVNFTKLRYWDISTRVTVQSGETKTVNVVPSRKGDLNDNGISADAGDVTMMLRASVYKLTPDERYDLNNNGRLADAGDVTMMLRASVYMIELL
uniref:Cohesin domain-containing protein n=1 Tax=Candidatus Methanophaga sp. ANME-1 ERB7 TaxID=2759913 RepID=A0A7G9Z8Z2_9EURY|nr:hypothetical protein HGIILDEE_00015 [Methanosarcinales archaeon ANME-1 ERB7]